MALERLGCQVIRFPANNFRMMYFLDRVRMENPDLILWAKLKIDPHIRSEFAEQMKLTGIHTACLVPDLYFNLSREWMVKKHDPMFTAKDIFTPDGGNADKWTKHGYDHHVLRQGIPDEFCYQAKPDPKYAFDVVFVGSLNGEYPYRTKLIDWLSLTYGKRFKWIGRADSDECRGHELNKLYASSKVIIGESVYSEQYWSNRIYETIGRGGFIIHPMVPGLEKEYEPFKHFIPYQHNDFQTLREVIDHYLDHADERQRIAQAGFLHTKKNYTLESRMKELLNVLRLPYN